VILELTAFWMMFWTGHRRTPDHHGLSCALTGAVTMAVMPARRGRRREIALRFDMERLPMIEMTGGASAGDGNNAAVD